jgi:Helicase HerA, central domain
MDSTTFFAATSFRSDHRRFGIKLRDRRSHIYVIGKTGTGKSTLLRTFMRRDVAHGHGFALLDPHGDLVEQVAREIPAEKRAQATYIDVASGAAGFGFNPLAGVTPANRARAASGLVDTFKKLWADSWGPRLEYILRNALLALLDAPGTTLADVMRLLSDDTFRRQVGTHITDPQVRAFWLREYAGYPERLRAEAIAPIQNKVGAFLSHPVLRRILSAPRSSIDLRTVMDSGQALLVNLSKGKLGADTSTLLGALLVTSLSWAAFGRADVPEDRRRDFFLYLDEFQSFTTLSLVGMLSELRKYRVGLVLANQYLAQLEEPIRDALLGNVGTLIAFRVGYADAELLAQEFYPDFLPIDLVNLPNHEIYLRLMVDGVPSQPFSATTLPPDA